MGIAQLLDELQYTDSPNYLRGDQGALEHVVDFGHIFRKAQQYCKLHGVYVLRADLDEHETVVPVVYVCEADSKEDADRIHRLVWNQNIVPFVLVTTQDTIRLYAGFRYACTGKQEKRGVLAAAVAFNNIARELAAFQSTAIDDGTVWREWGKHVTPETRVDWKLLENLNELDKKLRAQGLNRTTAHALIGQFVYLRYLHDRDILSDRKLARWEIDPQRVFGRQATVQDYQNLMARLQEWLNGSIFPLTEQNAKQITDAHIAELAQTFLGDDVRTGQLHLPFAAYDFSYIPIETLSVIYQQFLHTKDTEQTQARGKELGAYYTPLPLVNFMLSELDDQRPLREGMRVLDPSCGSGAFLVQCYRRFIERQRARGEHLSPGRLRQTLEAYIYGVDIDLDACRLAELSLILTLLDYINPPDLEQNPTFKLPTLHNSNIFKADFFKADTAWAQAAISLTFDWIVGNPPWKEISSKNVPADYKILLKWIQDNKKVYPTGHNQVAEAFTWEVLKYIAPEGVIGFVVPASSLFKTESSNFRREFFRQARVYSVANFANLVEVLFAGRARRPAAALFYTRRQSDDPVDADISDERILHYAPFVITEEIYHQIGQKKKRLDTWALTVNASDVREIRTDEVLPGEVLPWKLAMWGSPYDGFILRKIANLFPSFEQYKKVHGLKVRQGIALRDSGKHYIDKIEYVSELNGKLLLNFNRLNDCGRIFSIPAVALSIIPDNLANARKHGGISGPLSVCRPPHIILDEARRFAIFTDEFVTIPHPQTGIAGNSQQAELLCALALYLSSDFVRYHQFLLSAQWGIDTNVSAFSPLMQLPIPLDELDGDALYQWAALYRRLAAIDRQAMDSSHPSLFDEPETLNDTERTRLLAQLNAWVNDLLGLNARERMFISDMVQLKIPLTQGKVYSEANRASTPDELFAYARTLQQELDAFIEEQSSLRHAVTAVYDDSMTMVRVDLLLCADAPEEPRVLRADREEARAFAEMRRHLRSTRSQWVYYERNLRIYEETTTYLCKPRQRLLWTQSQAVLDAGEVIAETLMGQEA